MLPDAPHARDAATLPDVGTLLDNVSIIVRDELGPLVGATVVIDDANGARETGVTAVGGRVTIPRVAWGTGRITISASASRHPIESLAGFRRADLGTHADGTGNVVVTLVSYYDAFGVSGNLIGSPDPSPTFTLHADVDGVITTTGTGFTGSVQRRLPFHITAVDAVYTRISTYDYTLAPTSITRFMHDPLTAAATFDIDVSTPLPLTAVTGVLLPPGDGNRTQAGIPDIYVTSDESGGLALYGFASAMSARADSGFDFTATHLTTVDATRPVTLYYVETTDRLYSEIRVDGLPTASPVATADEWPMPPQLVSPAGGTTGALHDPITLTDLESGFDVTMHVRDMNGSVWNLMLAPGLTDYTIPAVPPGLDTSGWGAITLDVFACEAWPGHRETCRRDAGGDAFTITGTP